MKKTLSKKKQTLLAKKGWKVGTVGELLGLSPEEEAYVELKLNLALGLKRCRQRKKLSQVEAAKRLHSSQSRVAKMEAGDPSVSLDLLVRSLLNLGTPKKQLVEIMVS